ncbi:MAG: cyclic nucleotide-binding domain-containing protein [Deltaproteobacteria bacterium]|nr:cyclic nucleotide-binding domain-containing protein [Deltaproteobacteria bacterium]
MANLLFPARNWPADGEVDLRPPISAFGRYDLLERLADHDDDELFVARSDGFEGLFSLAALLRLKAARCGDVMLVSRFIEEARLAVRLEHRGILAVEDFGRVGGVYFIAFELVDGITLAELVRNLTARGLRLDARAAALIVLKVARALDAAHRTCGSDGEPIGIAHGNLCPHNVLIGRDGRVKVRGFAAPSVFRHQGGPVAAGLVGLAGAAPELLGVDAHHGGAEPSARTDVWSLGALLHEVVAGQPLFAGDTPTEVATAVRSVPIAPLSSKVPGLPAALDVVADEALVRDPRQRADDVRAWAHGLEAFLATQRFGDDELRNTLLALDEHDGAADTVVRTPTRVTRKGRAPAPVELGAAPTEALGAELTTQLARDPGVWGLVRLAERRYGEGATDEVAPMCRTAAVLFASRGLLAHALCAYDAARRLLPEGEVADDLRRLAELAGGDQALRQRELRRVGGLALQQALRAQTDGDIAKGGALATPFLSALPPDAFARLAVAGRVVRIPPGAAVLREGEPGDSLFAIGEGRLVVTCTPSRIDTDHADVEEHGFEERTDPGGKARVSRVVVASGLRDELDRSLNDDPQTFDIVDPRQTRVFLSALSAGDLFGEFSFLTGRPRSASVEAVTACRLFEIGRRAVGGALDEIPALRDALEAFYKERVLEWMLAKNEVFSLLEPAARRALLSQCGVYDIPAKKVVVREGELHDAMYFIKKGEVEVTHDDGGVQVFINKLGPGEFFGEIAALEGGPRRASVRATTDLEVFRISRDDLQPILEAAPEVKERLLRAMRARSVELKRRIAEQRRVLAAT